MATDLKNVYLERAKNEFNLAKAIFKISTNKKIKINLELKEESTYYSNVISCAYYSIFYSAKALLISKNIITKSPNEHKKTLDEFKELVEIGLIDMELLKIYSTILIKADSLLKIFEKEKSKRAKFTYKTLPQANKLPAEQSIKGAEYFLKNIIKILR
ncbi:MAG: hypothetical protein AB7V77_01525 [Candidatus Woesearchaeota archaeon]